jgi:hypothetical protein
VVRLRPKVWQTAPLLVPLYRARQATGQAENSAYPDIEITGERAFEVWGVITKSIRML